MAKKNYTADQVIDAIVEADGYVSRAAGILKCSPQTVYNYRDRYKSVADAWAGVREKRHDFVENSLHMAIKKGNVTAIIFYLKTQCKSRGYIERQEVTGADGGELTVRLSWGDGDGADA